MIPISFMNRGDTFWKLLVGLYVNFRNFKAILNMQRHRHNVKIYKLLVGLGPYQAYTKCHPCHRGRSVTSEAHERSPGTVSHHLAVTGDGQSPPGGHRDGQSPPGGHPGRSVTSEANGMYVCYCFIAARLRRAVYRSCYRPEVTASSNATCSKYSGKF